MRYYIGPWRWRANDGDSCFAPPVGAIGAIDLGTLPEMSAAGADRQGCLCWTDGTLGSDYDLLGSGDVREITRTAKITARFRKAVGSVPDGERLHDMILDCLISSADPDGQTAPMPIVPGTDGWMDLHLPGHGRVKGERFEWGRSKHTAKLRRMLRKEFAAIMADSEAGKLKDRVHHRRVLDDWCEKYGVAEWREFVPDTLQKDVPGRVKRETTITDDFNRSNAGPPISNSAAGWSWATVTGTLTLTGNEAKCATLDGTSNMATTRAQTDLSSADHYSEVTRTSGRAVSPIVRFNSAATTGYFCRVDSGIGSALYKIVANTATSIGSVSGDTTQPLTTKTQANGSTITGFKAGASVVSVTDTAITGNLRTGIMSRFPNDTGDNFSASDLAASGIVYVQLERGTRGLIRGMYTRFGGG